MSSTKLKVGLIGCGRVVSYGHGPAIRHSDDVELVAVADITPARREVAKDWFKLSDDNIYADHRDLLARSDVEAVVLAAPPRERVELIRDSLAADKHVLTEKPLAPSTAAANEMIEMAQERGLVFAVCHNYLFHAEFQRLKQLLDESAIGDLRVITMHLLGVGDNTRNSVFKPYWKRSTHAGGGIVMDMLHAIYLTEWLVGGSAQQVMAFMDTPLHREQALGVEDFGLIQVAFENSYASIQMAWGKGAGGVDVSGSEGYIRLRYANYGMSGGDFPGEMYRIRDGERTDYPFSSVAGDWMEHNWRSFAGILADFHRAILDGRPPIAPATASCKALQVVLGAYASAATGRTISLPLAEDNPVHLRGIDGIPELEVWEESRVRRAGIFGVSQ